MEFDLMKGSIKETSKLFWWFKYGASIPGKSEQQFTIQSCCAIFGPVIVVGGWYDESASQALKCIY